jgi:hypothetical protein
MLQNRNVNNQNTWHGTAVSHQISLAFAGDAKAWQRRFKSCTRYCLILWMISSALAGFMMTAC